MIDCEDGNGTSCCTISGVFLIDLGVGGEIILKWIIKK
jgi:hypothetical protein